MERKRWLIIKFLRRSESKQSRTDNHKVANNCAQITRISMGNVRQIARGGPRGAPEWAFRLKVKIRS